ncbi:MAG TPA: hypothetical protein VGM73_18190 [Candidatus Didemnitutus sp.]|jgi:hypothetical protein
MPAQEDDYILRQIEILGEIVAQLLKRRDPVGEEYALLQAFALQEKLFGMPAATFLKLSSVDQVAALAKNEPEATGRGKCLSYVMLLRDTASLYQLRGQGDFAFGARKLALNIALLTANGQPTDPATALVRELQGILAGAPLDAPIQALLDHFNDVLRKMALSD